MTSRSAIRCSTLGELGRSLGLQAGRALGSAVAVSGYLEQVGYLGQSEAETLRSLDHTESGDGFGRVEAVSAEAAVGRGQQAASFVVAQSFQIDPGRGGDLADPQLRGHAVPTRSTQSTRASSTDTWFSGTVTSRCRRPPPAVREKVKNEQH